MSILATKQMKIDIPFGAVVTIRPFTEAKIKIMPTMERAAFRGDFMPPVKNSLIIENMF